jgi:prevent-host-death family protein
MRRMSAKEAKNHFGELLLEAQKAPVIIEKNGKPVAVVYSMDWHEAAEEAKLEWLKRAVAEGVADLEEGRYTEFRSDEELHDFFDDLKCKCRASLEEEKSAGG